MTIKEINGVIHIYKGDTGHIQVSGFNPDINYNVYFQISDEDGNFYGEQLVLQTGGSDSVRFYINPRLSDSLEVPAGEDTATYYIGIKKSEVGINNEDTLVPDFGKKKVLVVHRKYAEGPING